MNAVDKLIDPASDETDRNTGEETTNGNNGSNGSNNSNSSNSSNSSNESNANNESNESNANNESNESNDNEESTKNTNKNTNKEPEEVDLNKVVELGDYAEIFTDSGDVKGIVYYRDADLIRILPDGLTNELKDFPQVDGDFDPDLGVKDVILYKKHRYDEFVKQQDFHVGQRVDGIASDGAKRATYVIISINEEDDSVRLREEGGDEIPIEFSGVGIPSELPFVILRISGIEEPEADAKNEEEAQGEENGTEKEEEPERPQFEVKVLGYVELPVYVAFQEAKSSQQIIPDTLQKSDAINDFINMYDLELQKDPRILRQNRVRVETLFKMKQDITAFAEDGTVKGTKVLSAQTIHDLLQMTDVPLVRPVLGMRKRIYELKRAQADSEIPEDLSVRYFYEELNNINKRTGKDTVTSLYSEQQEDFSKFERPWAATVGDPLHYPKRDSTVFRSILPSVETRVLEGLVPTPNPNPMMRVGLGSLYFGIERALTTTYRKSTKGSSVTKQALLAAEEAPLVANLLFPQAVATLMGTSRSGSLALDSGRSNALPRRMMDLLLEYMPSSPDVTAASILILDPKGGRIDLSEFLKGVDTPGLGFGDVIPTLSDYGLQHLEMTPALLKVFQSKIEKSQKALLSTLDALRSAEDSKKENQQQQQPQPQQQQQALSEQLNRRMRSEPFLVRDIEGFYQ